MMNNVRKTIKRLLPQSFYKYLQPKYHYILAYLGSLIYRQPSQKIVVIGVTGTKGKSSTVEILSHILRSDGKRVASLSTIQFSIAGQTTKNLFKMTMPGRFFVQKFLRDAVDAGCTHAIVEMTSEGAKQFRHRFIDMDALVFTNLTPEHIESHGSFDNYKNAKLELAKAVARSPKRPRYIVSNIDDEHGQDFLAFPVEHNLPYSLEDLDLYSLQKDSVSLVLGDNTIRVPLVGLFNVYNALASITLAKAIGVTLDSMQKSLRDLPPLKGRVEKFESLPGAKKNLTAVVDYAHTPDSLRQLYEAFPGKHKVCVLGNTGGGRDTWKRPEMGAIAEKYCDKIVLTNEDPYDENPKKIIEEMLRGITDKAKVEVIMNRREAIKRALELAEDGSCVLISGKGTDPYIMGPSDTKEPWSDAETTQELLKEI